jgi:hypothetical protein
MNKIHLLTITILLSGLACSRPKEVPQKKLNGINGEAIYLFNRDGSIKGLFKEKYNNHAFAILLVKDTITLGEDFVSSIYVANPIHQIRISRPVDNVLFGKDSKNDFKKYLFKPNREGIYDFVGTIEYDSIKTPFEYKFIVLPKR